ncbi:NnrU family protein [Cognatishimia sp. SS12]|uniref:NnrU family protein n=1 Tax=Cognatishimia sp. SS12 TaxID=2979465 RepID=UPI00232AE541|nr:NnrU family protein [Cognatishimia sp. SS12]MDC0739049.1 NnrU family protein [Cognatishimia sp. SS12]
MILLILGLLLWSAAHFFKRYAPAQRAALGDKGRGFVALGILAGVIMMILGYRMAEPTYLWPRAEWATPLNNLVMIFALYLTSPGPNKGALLHKMRHPMLTGVALWAAVHLLVNGDLPSLVLFGGLLVWTIADMIVINRAEPNWTPHPKGSIAKDAMFFAISIVLVGVIGYLHTLFGLSPFGG